VFEKYFTLSAVHNVCLQFQNLANEECNALKQSASYIYYLFYIKKANFAHKLDL
jgi:hypothetical protein